MALKAAGGFGFILMFALGWLTLDITNAAWELQELLADKELTQIEQQDLAHQQRYASRVSYWHEERGDVVTFYIQNRSSEPLYNVIASKFSWLEPAVRYSFPTIRPCTTVGVDLHSLYQQPGESARTVDSHFGPPEFTVDSHHWTFVPGPDPYDLRQLDARPGFPAAPDRAIERFSSEERTVDCGP